MATSLTDELFKSVGLTLYGNSPTSSSGAQQYPPGSSLGESQSGTEDASIVQPEASAGAQQYPPGSSLDGSHSGTEPASIVQPATTVKTVGS